MPVKNYKKNSAGRRFSSVDTFEDITKFEPEKSLISKPKRRTGRSGGLITVRHRGGGNKKFYRLVDFKQEKYNVPAEVLAIEYDPNRGARIALIKYEDGVKSYILAPQTLKVGDRVLSSLQKIEANLGNRMPIESIPVGYTIYNVELQPQKGGQLCRGAGNSIQLMAVEGDYATLKLPSGEFRKVSKKCLASIGQLSNPDRNLVRLGKAGRKRHMGWRPEVRGKAMNPVDHPHGGGEGHNPIGMRRPENPWGKPALGVKTRKRKKWSNKLIIKRRK
ncbi:MAG: 50S ribosomal protein L2 [Candidatus Magasanikbacteria bacterium GW2011_GWC2_40_17]|uniref:Large ribosomal subunit protein uL2 n=1 Tax=Candidatus Magasanikbacteria bacterium GW2011_GWA2_42_32 TaxID=1619039 RepID=A0A0G1CDM6_9BACT|nr:MAG: 50S ribosomal protein L2 [Candidatus Magasanikbacteria bacterium GW2011_GWC2_40_17]KKS56801.1 MAG: 50S ribosomal protein L2 [Candidatus Magasanikbacteria bacterium GW2011_GWA2_42_32]OGH86013.1 MAG: 50S ribosomal protein L2 [Candidatus Magasanikbacteria bacterium RIFOXYB2_FULL_38_10]